LFGWDFVDVGVYLFRVEFWFDVVYVVVKVFWVFGVVFEFWVCDVDLVYVFFSCG